MPQIGEYFVTVESSDGSVLEEHQFVATGHPCVGEQLRLDSGLYTVVRVCHEEDPEARTLQRYTHARVFVRRAGAGGRGVRREGEPSLVLPFAPPPPESTTASLLPPSLLAVLVVAGYGEQKLSFRSGWRRVGQLRRAQGHWAAITADKLWRLSRQAKRELFAAVAWSNTVAAEADLAWPPAARAEAEGALRRGTPVLRLVVGGRARQDEGDAVPRGA